MVAVNETVEEVQVRRDDKVIQTNREFILRNRKRKRILCLLEKERWENQKGQKVYLFEEQIIKKIKKFTASKKS